MNGRENFSETLVWCACFVFLLTHGTLMNDWICTKQNGSYWAGDKVERKAGCQKRAKERKKDKKIKR